MCCWDEHHWSQEYKRYDKTSELKSKAAMSIIEQAFNADGSRKAFNADRSQRMFDDVYNEELAAYDARQNAGNLNILQTVGNLNELDSQSAASGHITDIVLCSSSFFLDHDLILEVCQVIIV